MYTRIKYMIIAFLRDRRFASQKCSGKGGAAYAIADAECENYG